MEFLCRYSTSWYFSEKLILFHINTVAIFHSPSSPSSIPFPLSSTQKYTFLFNTSNISRLEFAHKLKNKDETMLYPHRISLVELPPAAVFKKNRWHFNFNLFHQNNILSESDVCLILIIQQICVSCCFCCCYFSALCRWAIAVDEVGYLFFKSWLVARCGS